MASRKKEILILYDQWIKKGQMMIKKKIKLVLIPIIALLLIIMVYCILLNKGYIPFSIQEKTGTVIVSLHHALKIESIFGGNIYPIIRIVANFPSKQYYLNSDKIKYLYGWEIIDIDYNLLFISTESSYLQELLEDNSSTIISEGSYNQLTLNKSNKKIEDIIILRLGNLWQHNAYAYLYLKIYKDGETIFNYMWYDKKMIKLGEWHLNQISVLVPVDKGRMRDAISKYDFGRFSKLRTIDTYNASFRFGQPQRMAMVMKKKNNVKIIYRNPLLLIKDELKNGLRQYWADIIKTTKMKEKITLLIEEKYPHVLEEWQLKNIIYWLSLFNNSASVVN